MEAKLVMQKGMDAEREGRLADAERLYFQVVQAVPGSAMALSQLGVVQAKQGKYSQAENCFRKAIAVEPGFIAASNNLAIFLLGQTRYADAEKICRDALQKAPDFIPLYISLGHILRMQERHTDAADLYRQALKKAPNDSNLYVSLAGIYIDQGQRAEAVGLLEKAIELNPLNGEAHRILSMSKKYKPDDPHLALMERLIADGISSLPYQFISSLHFALGKAYGDCNNYGKSFAHFEEGNRGIRKNRIYSTEETRDFFDQIKAVFTSDFIQRHKGEGSESVVPIFIIGMPRSGSSLVEQILASHPEVSGGGELGYLSVVQDTVCKINTCQYAADMEKTTAVQMRAMADGYLQFLSKHAAGRQRVTDKMPSNFLYVGLIKVLFPNAKVIHCMRRPEAVCLSMFQRQFASDIPYANNLRELGQYYRLYEGLMGYWRELLPGFMHEVRYEELVREPEKVVRGMLDYCGLDWHEDCLHFYRTERPGMTASAFDIKKPLYSDAMEKWRNYEPFIGDLIKELT